MPANSSIDDYIAGLPDDRRAPFTDLLETVRAHIDQRFDEQFDGRMAHWVVPLAIFPDGYHAAPGQPLPFLSVANQKGHIALYHLGLYADPEVTQWVKGEYAATGMKIDMGKSCIRFKNVSTIPLDVVGRLAARISLDDHVERYRFSR